MRSAVWLLAAAGAAVHLNGAGLIETVELVPTEYRHKLVQQLSLAEENQDRLMDAIQRADPDHRAALAFLIVNMPERDLRALDSAFLLSNLEYAYKARNATEWARNIPEELFFNHVLPYANVNERRDDWRRDFHDRFMPVVRDCKTPGEAMERLNVEAFKQLNVRYHARKRPKPDQSPYESVEANYASCTGLSILLVDACRAVGVPARVVGIPRWTDNSGNHTWVEVWDRQWNYIGACEPAPLNRAWFAGNASRADESDPRHRIYAASWQDREQHFPLVWARDNREVPADDVTRFYTRRRKVSLRVEDAQAGAPGSAEISVRLDGVLVAHTTVSETDGLYLAANETYQATLRNPEGGTALGTTFETSDEPEQIIPLRFD